MNLGTNSSVPSASLPWYGVRTKSNHEKVAANILECKGYEPYLPTYRSRRRWSDRVIEIDTPLFPGYVFCRFNAAERLPIISTPGVVSVIGFGKDPAPIDDSEIEAVKAILTSGLPAHSCSFLHEGQRVRIERGSLANLEGILVKKKSEWRVVVSVSLLQRSISVEIDREWVSAI